MDLTEGQMIPIYRPLYVLHENGEFDLNQAYSVRRTYLAKVDGELIEISSSFGRPRVISTVEPGFFGSEREAFNDYIAKMEEAVAKAKVRLQEMHERIRKAKAP